MSDSSPKVFVLIPSFNGKDWLGDCLRSVLALDYPNFAVVVIDNASTDRTTEYIRAEFATVQVLRLARNVGPGGALNAGMRWAAECGADYFLIMNNDIVIDAGALRALLDIAQRYPAAGKVTGKVYYYDQPDVLQTVGKQDDPIRMSGDQLGGGQRDVGQFDMVAERDFVDAVYYLVDRRLYDEIGGYDPGFYLQAEEFDWQVRAKKHGWKFYYTPHARLWHRVSQATGGSGNPIMRYFYMRSMIVALYRHGGWHRFIRFYTRAGATSSIGLLKGLAQLNAAKIRPRLAQWLGFWAGTLWLIHRRPAGGVPWLIKRLSG